MDMSGLSSSEQAIKWFVTLNDLSVCETDHQAFQEWYLAHPDHAQTYEEIANLWHSKDFETAAYDILSATPHSSPKLQESLPHPISSSDSLPLSLCRLYIFPNIKYISACIFLLCCLMPFLLFSQNLQYLAISDLQTQKGETSQFVLPDGSKIFLNGQTSLSFNVNHTQRSVHLYQGEAYFDIAQNPDLPFKIYLQDTQIDVIGTRFNIALTPSSQRIFLEHGQITFTDSGISQTLTEQDLLIRKEAKTIRYSQIPDALEMGWLKGEIHFKNRPFTEAINSLQKYYKGTILMAPFLSPNILITGHYHTSDPFSVIQNISQIAQLTTLKLPGDIIFIF